MAAAQSKLRVRVANHPAKRIRLSPPLKSAPTDISPNSESPREAASDVDVEGGSDALSESPQIRDELSDGRESEAGTSDLAMDDEGQGSHEEDGEASASSEDSGQDPVASESDDGEDYPRLRKKKRAPCN